MKFKLECNGIGLLICLLLIFIVLKVFDVITWSWWVVFWPCYVPLFLAFITLVVIVMDDE
jgi:hypothetical protein